MRENMGYQFGSASTVYPARVGEVLATPGGRFG
jgi:hypothetical protein